MLEERAYRAELAHVPIPEEYEVLDTNALAERLGLSRNTIFTYLNRKSYHRIPKPDRRLRTLFEDLAYLRQGFLLALLGFAGKVPQPPDRLPVAVELLEIHTGDEVERAPDRQVPEFLLRSFVSGR